MNVIIYNLFYKTQELIYSLEKIQNISIHFALNEKELFQIVKQVQPEILFTNNKTNDIFFRFFTQDNPLKYIFVVDDTNEDVFNEFPSKKRISLRKILAKINDLTIIRRK